MEETVLDLGTLHLDMVGEPEAPLEASGGNALMEILDFTSFAWRLPEMVRVPSFTSMVRSAGRSLQPPW